MLRLLISIIPLFYLAACSIAPLSSTNTARSLGQGKTNIEMGNIASNYYTRLAVGISPDLDAGTVVEFGNYSTTGLWAKYALVNGATGFAWALEGGYGAGDKSSYSSAGNIFSIAIGSIEFYWNARAINMNVDEADFDTDESIGGITFKEYKTLYLYNAGGMNIWFNPNFGMNIYILKLTGKDIIQDSPSTGFSFMATI